MSVSNGGKVGTLYVVATPIGNLEDFSPRARRVLSEVDYVLAEDTRRCLRLATHFKLRLKLKSCHAHNEAQCATELPQRLGNGENIALLCDAGTPGISDPGARLVRAVQAAGLPVACIPGPSALSAALSIAGIPAPRFVFEGFLPSPGADRRRRIQALKQESRPILLFEAPHRIQACLEDCVAILGGGREASLVKEISKLHERVHRDTLEVLCRDLGPEPRGEFVLMIQGIVETAADLEQAQRICAILGNHLPRRDIIQIVTQITGLSRNQIYDLVPHKKPVPE